MARRKNRKSARRWANARHRRWINKHSSARRLRVETLEDRRMLAVFTVSNLDDTGVGSLREAITLANADAIADTIDFSVTGQIGIASQLPTITKAVTITGQNRIGILTDNGSRVFNVDDGTETLIDVELRGLTLNAFTYGNSVPEDGGLILNRENLTLTSSTLSFGAAGKGGGIYNAGTVTITDSGISFNEAGKGGGIYNAGTATITDSTVLGNSSLGGGGIYNLGPATITDSTVSGNYTVGPNAPGGGILASGFGSVTLINSTVSGNHTDGSNSHGGGISESIIPFLSSITLVNSTVSENSTFGDTSRGGGIYSGSGGVTLIGSTVAYNDALGTSASGGGIWSNSALVITGSIVALNTDGLGMPDIRLGSELTVDYSLIGDTSGSGIFGGTGTGNLLHVDPMLQPLAYQAGPTKTHGLLPGSPAIDMGDPAILFNPIEFDQRGAPFARVFDGGGGSRIDIGSYERQSFAANFFVVDTLVDESDGDYSPVDVSLREAITAANGSVGSDVITFAGSLTGGTILLDDLLGEMTITYEVIIDATALADGITIDAGNGTDNTFNTGDGYRIFNIDDSTATVIDVELRGLTLTGGDTAGDGGAIFNRENLTLTSSTLSGNSADRGGGIYHSGTLGGIVTITNSTVSGNSAESGGGISNSGTATITNSTLSGNSADRGGGIFNNGDGFFYFQYPGNATITNSTLSGNSAETSGGGIYNQGIVTLIDSTVSGNSADRGGGISNYDGGFYSYDGTATITNSTLSGNSAESGGGIDNRGGTVTITSSLVVGNTAALTGSEIRNNSTVNLGDYNLFGDSSQTTAQALDGVTTGATDITATNNGNMPTTLASILNTTLADNGGPTQTHALSAGSPAINSGSSVETYDQRGAPFQRDDGNGVDIGAYEMQTLNLFVDTLTDKSDGDYSMGDLSLREAIDLANANPGADTIDFSVSGTILLDDLLGEMTITDEVIIDATLLAGGITIDAGNGIDNEFNTGDGYRIFNVDDGTGTLIDVELRGLTLTGGDVGGSFPDYNGGAIFSQENFTLINSTLSSNSANNRGGGIYNYSGNATITNSTLSGNAADEGGAIVNVGTATITNSTLSGNAASYRGGGIFNLSTATITSSLIAGNTAASSGSEIWNGSTVNLDAYNLIGDSSQTTILALHSVTTGATDITATSNGSMPTALTAILDTTLADNGGPTQTHALSVGSPAINTGDPAFTTPPDFDQRGTGFDRIRFGTVDIGAFEVQVEFPSLIVTTELDVVDNTDRETSLREAVLFANSNAGSNTITFAGALSGDTILLDDLLGEITITDAVIVDATLLAGGITIDAGNGTDNEFNTGDGYRIFNVDDGTGTLIDVELRGLTLTGGDVGGSFPDYNGGAIFSQENFTLINSTLSSNSANNRGGGIYNYSGNATITNSTLSGNAADEGGAIVNVGTATITNSTLSGNAASYRGGGIFNLSTATITSSLIAGNTAASSGSEIWNGSTVNLDAYNLIGDSSQTRGQALVGVSTGATDILATSDGSMPTALTSILDTTLADNGGPTQTHALSADSPAINSGDPAFITPPAFDQRGPGFDRIRFGTVDIGALEVQTEAPSLIVTTELDVVDNTDGDTSLREAVLFANSNAGSNTITFAAALTGGTILLEDLLGEIAITDEVIIDATALAGGITIDAGNGTDNAFNTGDGYRIFNVDDGTATEIDVELHGLTLTGGDIVGLHSKGGAIFNRENLTLTSSTLSGNATGFGGGGINNLGTATITNSTLSGNAAEYGGGIVNASTATITSSTLSGNTADDGGGIYNGGTATITSSTLSGNTADDGGGIYNGGTATITNSTLSDNSADDDGGGIYNLNGGIAMITGSTLAGNSANNGGGLYNRNGTAEITNSTLSGNSADSGGGGIFNRDNSGSPATVTLTGSTLSGNTADDGGGILNLNGGAATIITNSTLSGNSATISGGGIINITGTVALASSLIAGNTATSSGGEIWNDNTVNLDAYNLIGDSSQTTAQALDGVSVGATDITATSDGSMPTALTSILDTTLADNGGPTQTHALVLGSPAIDSGNNALAVDHNGQPLLTDQRGDGFARIVDGGQGTVTVDIGAFELALNDFGDAPASYGTTIAGGGASHQAVGPRLGSQRDVEANGSPSPLADGDDLAGIDDEDGVLFGVITAGTQAGINVDLQNAAAAKVDAWIDFNGDGNWDDPGENILSDRVLGTGLQTLNYSVPAGASNGVTFARIRVSTVGGLSVTGPALDGEVEDYAVTIGSVAGVSSATINAGRPTRSEVTSIEVTFGSHVEALASDFILTNTTTGQNVTGISVSNNGTGISTLTFASGPGINSGTNLGMLPTLSDGIYELRYRPAVLDGTDTPIAIDDFFRKYGETDVTSATVGLTDFAAFRSAFGKSLGDDGFDSSLDANRDGAIGLSDFAAFRSAFGN